MLRFDETITVFLNSFAHRSVVFDKLVGHLQSEDLLQGALAIAVIYFVWFQAREETEAARFNRTRQSLLCTLLACIPAVLTARVIASLLPYRTRPIFNPDLHLRLAYGLEPQKLLQWSSFPSDHAVLFFALATGVFFASRNAGLLLFLHAIAVVSLPRIYLGVHYPSDILVGAIVGSSYGVLANWSQLQRLVTGPAKCLYELSPGLFHSGMFYLAYETAVLYNDPRRLAMRALAVLKPMLMARLGR